MDPSRPAPTTARPPDGHEATDQERCPGELHIVIVEDHDLVREGIISILSSADAIDVVGVASSAAEAVDVVERTEPHVVLLDLRLGGEDGTAVARALRERGATARILVLSAHDHPQDLRAAVEAGANGYLLKTSGGSELIAAIRGLARGERIIDPAVAGKLIDEISTPEAPPPPKLTGREREVLDLVGEGLTAQAIANRIGISARTVHKHVENLFKKFSVHSRAELVAAAFRHDLLS